MSLLIPHFVGDGIQTIEKNKIRQNLIIKIGSSKMIISHAMRHPLVKTFSKTSIQIFFF